MKADIERKRYFKAPLHLRRKRMHVHLSPELRKLIGKRALLVRAGDKVRIMRGKNKNQEKVVAKVDYRYYRVYLQGVSRKNARGEERLIPFHPSNLMLISPVATEERKKKFPELFKKVVKEEKMNGKDVEKEEKKEVEVKNEEKIENKKGD